jgi:L-seryl-tRNA(Ser) seleniumtransferase
VGGGGAAVAVLPSAAVRLPERIAGPLRGGRPAVFGRVVAGRCQLDLRGVPAADDVALIGAVRAAAAQVTAACGPAPPYGTLPSPRGG